MKVVITVGDLKEALKGVDDCLPVTASAYPHNKNFRKYPNGFYVVSARREEKSSISNEDFTIYLGEGFDY